MSTPAHGDLELGGPRHGFDFQNSPRNKRSLTNHRLGVDYESLAAIAALRGGDVI